MRNCLLYLLILLSLLPYSLVGQLIQSRGTDFYFTINDNAGGSGLPELCITGKRACSGMITSLAGYSQAWSITAGGRYCVNLPSTHVLTANQTITNYGLHVTSSDSITCHVTNYQLGTGDGTTILPTTTVGTRYRVQTYMHNASVGYSYPSNFSIVATRNGTNVTVTPNVASGAYAAGATWTVALNAGQTYYLTTATANGDFTGSLVTANYPIAVYGGSSCTQVTSGIGYCDMLYEQNIPTTLYGREFLLIKDLAWGDNSFHIRATTDVNGTILSVNGVAQATINAGQYWEGTYTDDAYITSNQPIQVMQYMRGRAAAGSSYGDPAMTQVPSRSNFSPAAYFTTAQISSYASTVHRIKIIARTTQTAAVKLDGAAVAGWTPMTSLPTWSYAYSPQYSVPGAHSVTSTDSVMAFVYGWDNGGGSVSYSYFAASGPDVAPLPVEFMSIGGKFVENKGNEITWEIASQMQATHFVVERSINALQWTEIQNVPKTNAVNYTTYDNQFTGEKNYYRIKAIDVNGQNSFSPTIEISNNLSNQVKVYPTHFTDQLTVEMNLLQDQNVHITLLDLNGKSILDWNKSYTAGVVKENIGDAFAKLAAGSYFVRVQSQTLNYSTQVIKN